MASKHAFAKTIQATGIALFAIALGLFSWSLTASRFVLNEEVLQAQIDNDLHWTYVAAHIAPMKGERYPHSFAFISALDAALARAQADIRKQVESVQGLTPSDAAYWDAILQDYKRKAVRFPVAKASSTGLLPEHSWWFFALSIGLGILGVLLYLLPQLRQLPGIKHNHMWRHPLTSRGWLGIALGTWLIAFYVLLYFYPEHLVNWVILVDPISEALSGQPASQWFLYGFLYTLAIALMGLRMLIRYRHNRYQIARTLSVMFFQTAFAFLIPEILVRLNKPYFDFKNIWPLDYDFFFEWNLQQLLSSGTLGLFMLGWGIALAVVGVPLLTYLFGKRWYCSWVCGCGGLAETLGDPFRHLSDKRLRAWRIERWLIHAVLVFAVLMTALVLYTYFTGEPRVWGLDSYQVRKWYGLYIGSWFAGVVGTGFYPLMGNRVWCRFGCPLAAYLGIVQRFRSRFRITTNGGQCISCGNCSTYCEMGIDVRWYAQRGQDVVRASCVGCGICAAVCPRGVLRLENASADVRQRASTLRVLHIEAGKPIRLES